MANPGTKNTGNHFVNNVVPGPRRLYTWFPQPGMMLSITSNVTKRMIQPASWGGKEIPLFKNTLFTVCSTADMATAPSTAEPMGEIPNRDFLIVGLEDDDDDDEDLATAVFAVVFTGGFVCFCGRLFTPPFFLGTAVVAPPPRVIPKILGTDVVDVVTPLLTRGGRDDDDDDEAETITTKAVIAKTNRESLMKFPPLLWDAYVVVVVMMDIILCVLASVW